MSQHTACLDFTKDKSNNFELTFLDVG